MKHITIKKGLNLNLQGSAQLKAVEAPFPQSIALSVTEFESLKPKLLVKKGDTILGGSPLISDKHEDKVKFCSPLPGQVSDIIRGPRRKLEKIIITPNEKGEFIKFQPLSEEKVSTSSKEELLDLLLSYGFFPFFLQRPFDCIPDLMKTPKAIFVNAMDSAPNGACPWYLVEKHLNNLSLGFQLLSKLTPGKVHLISDKEVEFFQQVPKVEKHLFKGPHPSGLVGTHIHFIDPISKGDVVWHISLNNLATISESLAKGQWFPKKRLCLSGSSLKSPMYYDIHIGADLKTLLKDKLIDGEHRIISGNIFFGQQLNNHDHLLLRNHSLQVIPEGRKRRFLGWAMPGLDQLSVTSRSFLSSVFPQKSWALNTNRNGGKRAIIWTDIYDEFMPLDIIPNFLVRAVLAGDLDEAENLGILEIAPEDMGICNYICPSKIDFSETIAQGLKEIQLEGY